MDEERLSLRNIRGLLKRLENKPGDTAAFLHSLLREGALPSYVGVSGVSEGIRLPPIFWTTLTSEDVRAKLGDGQGDAFVVPAQTLVAELAAFASQKMSASTPCCR